MEILDLKSVITKVQNYTREIQHQIWVGRRRIGEPDDRTVEI